ncbi:MAG: TldD/PmbA family protein [Elusimicrobia bacterium]|nr:TldD/PmbA family protein [Elusimicrobiota bacterium]
MSKLSAVKPEDWAPVLAFEEYAEAYLEESWGASLHFEDSRTEEIASGADVGAGLRYLRRSEGPSGFETRHGSLNAIDPAAAMALARRLAGSSLNGRSKGLSALTRCAQPVTIRPEDIGLERKIELLVSVDRALREEFPLLRQVSLTYAERRKAFMVLNSEGHARYEERVATLFVADVTAERDGILQTGHEVVGGAKGFELLLEHDPLRLARGAAARAVAKLSAPPAKAGEMPVVLAASAGGTFVHEAIGHSLEADHVQEGTSPAYVGKVGQVVAPENLSIVDDPTLPFARGSFAFDDEGTLARPTAVVKDGVLREYLYDRITAAKDGKAPNGHGRRESYRHRPIPRMSNLYIAPGKDDPARILSELDRGLLVTRMGGGQVNTATGEFVFEVDEGFWVEGGVIKHQVRDANLLGIGPETLKSIDRLGWDIGWGIGTCGKDGQGVPVSDGQPTLRIPRMLVGGRHD